MAAADCSGSSGSSDNTDNEGLHLSYNSSPFDDSDGDFIQDDGSVRPYQFEPYDSSGSSDGGETGEAAEVNNRVNRCLLESNEWCQCNRCIVMPTHTECICCREAKAVINTMEDEKCITDHHGFGPVCLNLCVLRAAYSGYRQQYKDEMDETPERHRCIAYRQFVHWCYGYLGRHNRVPIPSCVVRRIRETFVSDKATGFKWPE